MCKFKNLNLFETCLNGDCDGENNFEFIRQSKFYTISQKYSLHHPFRKIPVPSAIGLI